MKRPWPPRSGPLLAVLMVSFSPGPVQDLVFEPAGEGWVIRWNPPVDAAADTLRYELEDRGSAAWRPLHAGPETRLRVLQPRRGPCTLRVRAVDAAGARGPWSEVDCRIDFDRPPISTTPACTESEEVGCLLDRFAVRVTWRQEDGRSAAARPAAETKRAERDFGFGSTRRDVTIRILDRCATAEVFGVEYDARHAAEFTLEITDTRTGDRKSFRAPEGRDRPPRVHYNQVFASCEA